MDGDNLTGCNEPMCMNTMTQCYPIITTQCPNGLNDEPSFFGGSNDPDNDLYPMPPLWPNGT